MDLLLQIQIKVKDEEYRFATWRATQENLPFGMGPVSADATPDEILAAMRIYQRNRQEWIDKQWAIVLDVEAELEELLAKADIPRCVWDAYADGHIDEPTCSAYQRNARSHAIA